MTIYAYEAQTSWLPTALNRSCSVVEFDEDGLLNIHFGETQLDEEGYLEAERTISILGTWRLESGPVVAAASGDLDDPARVTNLDRLVGQTLVEAVAEPPGYDLTLTFSNELVVRCFPCAAVEFTEDIDDDDEAVISWWLDGVDMPDDWEEPNEPGRFQEDE
jgi:hypothetical protein